MSKWQEEKAERNRQSLVRLTKALPSIFPPAVLSRALSRPFVPPTPRLAIDSYWRAHPIRADRLARALAARSGATQRLDLAAWQQPQDRIARHIPNAARALSRACSHARPRFLLRVRTTGVSLRLACRSLGRRRQQKCDMALRVRDCVAVLECAEWTSQTPAAAASTALQTERRTAVEDRRDRPSRPAVSGMERSPRCAMAEAS